MTKNRLLALLLTFFMIFLLVACGDSAQDRSVDEEDEETEDVQGSQEDEPENSDDDDKGKPSSLTRSTGMKVTAGGDLKIARLSRTKTKAMGDKDTWTVFVYVCGTDLESDGGMATMDIQEMIDSAGSDNVRFVIQTGGTNSWDNDTIDKAKIQRYVIEGGSMSLAIEDKLENMGNANTLSSFLSWGVENYAAEKMGVVFWNHGGGSISGVCFDELNDNDSLSLLEIEEAFTSVYDQMTDQFEFIGFDACLMGSVETANVLAPHARYMIGSEELEPGYGWDYKALGDYLAQNPSADGAEVGKEVVDAFYAACELDETETEATLSCIDLSKIDELIYAFNEVAQNMYQASSEKEQLSQVVKGIVTAENYGGNNKSEGYTNMVDLGSILENLSANVEGADAALKALAKCVVYMKNGSSRSGAHGLSIYYPLEVQGSMELSIFKDVSVSPYYMSFVDKMAYGSTTNGDMEGYSDENWFGKDSEYWEDDYSLEAEDQEYWSYLDGQSEEDYNFDEAESAVILSQEAALNEDGYYGLTISPQSLDYVSSVYCSVFFDVGDGDTVLDLGIDDNVWVDWETGEVQDNFNGYWFALPDGQPIATYLVETGETYSIYTSPVLLNDEETNLRIRMDYIGEDDYKIRIIGAWDGIDEETGMSAKEIVKLKEGDIIVPMYYAYSMTSDVEDLYYGYEYTFSNDPMIDMNYLFEGDYHYSFIIDDIFGNSIYTDFTLFSIDENGEIYFDDGTGE